MIQEMHIFVTGSVQGVGFRAAVKRHALLHHINGFVRNLPDGRVEICVQGKEEQINDFLQSLQSKPGLATISHLEKKKRPAEKLHTSFEVIH